MTTIFILGLTLFGMLFTLILLPLVLLKVAFTLVIGLVVLPFKILGALVGGLAKGVFKGMFLLALLMIPFAIIALPFTILGFGAWLLYRAIRPRRSSPAYVVA